MWRACLRCGRKQGRPAWGLSSRSSSCFKPPPDGQQPAVRSQKEKHGTLASRPTRCERSCQGGCVLRQRPSRTVAISNLGRNQNKKLSLLPSSPAHPRVLSPSSSNVSSFSSSLFTQAAFHPYQQEDARPTFTRGGSEALNGRGSTMGQQ